MRRNAADGEEERESGEGRIEERDSIAAWAFVGHAPPPPPPPEEEDVGEDIFWGKLIRVGLTWVFSLRKENGKWGF